MMPTMWNTNPATLLIFMKPSSLQKSQYIRNGLTDLYEIWYADAKWVSYPPWPLKKFEFHKSKMADGRHFTNRYIILSQQPFD